MVDSDGTQHAGYRDVDPRDLPVEPVRDAQGNWLVVQVPIADRQVKARLWLAEVGHISVFLLDTNVEGNSDSDRDITFRLYGGDEAHRLKQEMVLGIGGARALRLLGLAPSVWHMNEGHAAFLAIELLREQMAAGFSMEAGLEAVAAQCVFTTHTPVAAGHDAFPDHLFVEHFSGMAAAMRIGVDRLLVLGRAPGIDGRFNMTRLALNGTRRGQWRQPHPWCGFVATLRGSLARDSGGRESGGLCHQWCARADLPLVGMGAVSRCAVPRMARAALRCGCLAGSRPAARSAILGHRAGCEVADAGWRACAPAAGIPPHRAWVRRSCGTSRSCSIPPIPMCSLSALRAALPPTSVPRCCCVIVSGCSSWCRTKSGRCCSCLPARLIRPISRASRWLREIKQIMLQPEFAGRVVFLEDYDIQLARWLVTGVDVWLNNPIAPLEASGTSGIKASVNGRLNLSILDGWWAEAFDGHNGWGIPGADALDEGRRDYLDAAAMLDTIEEEVVPLYYARNNSGLSPDWVRRCRHAMASVIPRFNMRRVVRDYASGLYLPAAAHAAKLKADGGKPAVQLAEWKQRVRSRWEGVRILNVRDEPRGADPAAPLRMQAKVQLSGLTPADLRVEFKGDTAAAGCALRACTAVLIRSWPAPMASGAPSFSAAGPVGADGSVTYEVSAVRPGTGQYQLEVRVYPWHPLLTHPLEMGLLKSL